MQLLSHWLQLLHKRLVHRSGDGDFVTEAVDKIQPFAAVDKLMTEFYFMLETPSET
jgi:hypothetical protein